MDDRKTDHKREQVENLRRTFLYNVMMAGYTSDVAIVSLELTMAAVLTSMFGIDRSKREDMMKASAIVSSHLVAMIDDILKDDAAVNRAKEVSDILAERRGGKV